MANLGHQYEDEIVNRFKQMKMLHPNFKSTIGDAHNPDVMIKINNQTCIIEVKRYISAADFGQINLIYESNKWVLSSAAKNQQFRAVLKSQGFEAEVNKQWSKFGAPFKFLTKPRFLTEAQVKHDNTVFKEFKWDAPANLIDTYYRNKGVDYIQIKGMGLFKISGGSSLIKKQIPIFRPTIKMRVRVKPSGDKGTDVSYYDFNAAIEAFATGTQKSRYDLDTNFDEIFTKEKK